MSWSINCWKNKPTFQNWHWRPLLNRSQKFYTMRQSCICNKANLLAFASLHSCTLFIFNSCFCHCRETVSVLLMSERLAIPGCGFGKTKHYHLVVKMWNCKIIFPVGDLSNSVLTRHPVHVLKHCTHLLQAHSDACQH